SVSGQTGISDPFAAIGQAVSVLITCTSEHDPHGFKKGDGRRTSRREALSLYVCGSGAGSVEDALRALNDASCEYRCHLSATSFSARWSISPGSPSGVLVSRLNRSSLHR